MYQRVLRTTYIDLWGINKHDLHTMTCYLVFRTSYRHDDDHAVTSCLYNVNMYTYSYTMLYTYQFTYTRTQTHTHTYTCTVFIDFI